MQAAIVLGQELSWQFRLSPSLYRACVANVSNCYLGPVNFLLCFSALSFDLSSYFFFTQLFPRNFSAIHLEFPKMWDKNRDRIENSWNKVNFVCRIYLIVFLRRYFPSFFHSICSLFSPFPSGFVMFMTLVNVVLFCGFCRCCTCVVRRPHPIRSFLSFCRSPRRICTKNLVMLLYWSSLIYFMALIAHSIVLFVLIFANFLQFSSGKIF